ncbi:MAG: tRNA uridine-5-carboxymethylaminomethyl(34) synthesis GTPase MnmE [Gammaproteobacteria bacterium]|nr:tRNA uridine-5-carboxymethylaminomethyl(34) synthesis GTPase MnmE [Gammaproteobacteria bacterium]
MHADDTIAAIATPPGTGGVGILRLSGADAVAIGEKICGTLPMPRTAAFRDFKNAAGQALDQGLVLHFRGPASFTGEDVVELHGHGGAVVMDSLLNAALEHGARQADPGEFTQRAFLNDKLDLAQAEAVADLIESGSAEAARAALRSLQGEFSARVHELVGGVIHLRTWVEAAMDFPEEEIDFLADQKVLDQVDDLLQQFTRLENEAKQGVLLSNGMHLVIAGRPNAGKSSLLNKLAGYEAAIVTDIPGTTRDLLRENISIDGMPVHIVDTAGIRSHGDAIEKEGIRRAKAELKIADRALLVTDTDDELAKDDELYAELPAGLVVTVVHNKIDLRGQDAAISERNGQTEIYLSALTGEGIDLLREHLREAAGFTGQGGSLSARRRHLDALRKAHGQVQTAKSQLTDNRAGELMAEELRAAQQSLNEITGEFTSDDLLGKIFSSFCIGK